MCIVVIIHCSSTAWKLTFKYSKWTLMFCFELYCTRSPYKTPKYRIVRNWSRVCFQRSRDATNHRVWFKVTQIYARESKDTRILDRDRCVTHIIVCSSSRPNHGMWSKICIATQTRCVFYDRRKRWKEIADWIDRCSGNGGIVNKFSQFPSLNG